MHDQSASRISGRTRAAVCEVYVRASRIAVLESAGNFTRGECHDLSAEKIQRVNALSSQSAEFFSLPQFSKAGTAGCDRKFQAMVHWWQVLNPAAVNGIACVNPGIADFVVCVPNKE